MAKVQWRYAILILLSCCCALAQRGYYQPVQFRGSGIRFIDSLPIRRSDSCDYEDAACVFFLLCLMGGGISLGPCGGSLLSTCCAAPTTNNRRWRQQEPQPSQVVTASNQQLQVNQGNEDNSTFCGTAQAKPQSRIVGGQDALYGEFPWQAHIKLNRQQCGGVLLNNFYVLTAAHCIYKVPLEEIKVLLGVYDIQDHSRQEFPPQTFSIVEKKIHPSFKYQQSHPDRYDVALLKLDKAAQYQANVVPICLPQSDWNFQGWKGVITGWGKTDNSLGNRYGTRLLQKVEVPIISNEVCEKWHMTRGIEIKVSPEMMCAGYEDGKKDACVGDSGGPLMVVVNGRWTLAGLVSAGFGCAQKRQPGIYHRVTFSVDWIRANLS